jgi:hypothetical protein
MNLLMERSQAMWTSYNGVVQMERQGYQSLQDLERLLKDAKDEQERHAKESAGL